MQLSINRLNLTKILFAAGASQVSGFLSLGIVFALNNIFGENEAALYLYSTAFATLVGAGLSIGIPEYSQVIVAGRSKEFIKLPALILIVAFSMLVIEGLNGLGNSVSFSIGDIAFYIGIIICGTVLNSADLSFKYKLLNEKSPILYLVLNFNVLLVSFFLYLTIEGTPLVMAAGIILLLTQLWFSLLIVQKIPINFKMTWIGVSKSQFAFYMQRLFLVYLETSVLVQAHSKIAADDYVILGILIRLASPLLLIMHIIVGQRQARILAGHETKSDVNWHLITSLILVSLCSVSTLTTGESSIETLFLVAVIIRFWVVAVSIEFQRQLPKSPLTLICISFIVWFLLLYILGMIDAGMSLMVNILVCTSILIVIAYRYCLKMRCLNAS